MRSYRFQTYMTLLIIGFFISCQKVGFKSDPNFNRCQNFNQDCITADGFDHFDYSINFGPGQVDILAVIDNSRSMRPEQQKMGERFGSLLNVISNLDYRIAITTTDVTGTGLQGNLLTFGNGSQVLTPSTPNKEALFLQAVQVGDTGSGDERGIYAANLAVDRGDTTLFRPGVALSMIVLSDEDERSGQLLWDNGRPLETYDLPATLIANVRNRMPGKAFKFHSIIIQPGDTSCLNAQAVNQDRGFEGTKYYELTNITGGVQGNICAGDYSSQLTNIGYSIQDQRRNLPLACRPYQDQVQVDINPSSIGWTLDAANHQIVLNSSAPPGTTVRLRYKCPTL